MKNTDNNMFAWLIYDHEGAERNRDYIAYHQEVGARYGITFQLVYAEELLSDQAEQIITDDSSKQDAAEARPDFVIVRANRHDINELFEDYGIPTFNNSHVAQLANHKGRCVGYIFENTSVPTISTTVLSAGGTGVHITEQGPDSGMVGRDFFSYDEAVRFLKEKIGYVVKPAGGHGGAGVCRIPDDSLDAIGSRDGLTGEELTGYLTGEGLKRCLLQDDLILQPFIEGPGEDIRVYVIGDRIVAAVRRRAPEGEFRANASLGGEAESIEPDEILTDYVQQIIEVFDFGMVGIDFIVDKNGNYVFNEIEDAVGARMLYRTRPEIDILDEYIRFIRESIRGMLL